MVTRRHWLFALLLIPYAWFDHNDAWNQISRLAELHAVVVHGTIRIDDYQAYTGDKAMYQGHYYSEKGPGTSLLAAPAFAATVLVQRLLGQDPEASRPWWISAWIATVGSVGVIAAAGGVAIFSLVAPSLGVPVAFLATIGLCLGTIWFPYSTALFAHAGTMGLLAIALWGVFAPEARQRQGDVIAGLASGLAVAGEYPAALPAGVLAVYLLSANRRSALRFCLATVPGALVIMTKNYLVTGSVLQLSYGSNPEFPLEGAANYFGHGWPDPHVMAELVWRPYRGLLWWSPVLAMAVPGFVSLARINRRLAIVVGAASLLSFLQVSAFYHWHGGFAVGPRYLAPAFPFLGIAAAYGIAKFPRTGAFLVAVSIALMLMVTVIGIAPPDGVMNPLVDYYLNRIQRGLSTPNLGTIIGLPLPASLAILILGAAVLGRTFIKRAGQLKVES